MTVKPEHQCRYLRRNDQRCTAEAADPDGEILLCTKHLAHAMQLLTRVQRSKS